MRVSLFSVLFVIVCFFAKAQTPVYQWNKKFGNSGEEYAFGIALDDSGNSYVTGLIDSEDTAFHKMQCINHDIFVARYDNQGTMNWLQKIGASSTDIGWGITLDKNQNIYSVSTFMDTLYLNNDTIIGYGFNDILITKFNTQGDLLWAKSAGGLIGDYGYAIATDSQGNVYVTGSFYGTANFSGITLTSSGYNDVFLAKYGSQGNLVWAINAGGSSADNDEGYAITLDKEDYIYLAGKFGKTGVFSGDTVISCGNSDIFIAKYDSAGTLKWIRQSGGTGADLAQGIKTDKSGSVFLTGYFAATSVFGSDTLTSKGNADIFVAKYDASGNLQWVKSAGGTGDDEGAAVTVDSNGKIFLTGYFSNMAAFDTSSFNSAGLQDAYVASLDSLGNFIWIKTAGGTGADASSSVCVDSSNAVYFAGTFNNTCTFDNTALTSSGGSDYFVSKILTGNLMTIQNTYSDDASNLTVFPNPSPGVFSLLIKDNKTAGVTRIKITNAMGEQVCEKQISNSFGVTQLDLSAYEKGIYFLELHVNAKVILRKIVLY